MKLGKLDQVPIYPNVFDLLEDRKQFLLSLEQVRDVGKS
jgi:hypothetical protein